MKKITIAGIALLTFFAGFGQSRVSSLGVNNPLIFPGVSYGNLAPCDEENPNDGTFAEGYNCSSASSFKAANDVLVNAGEIFTVNQITASIFANNGIATVDVKYYDDAAGFPGSLLGSEFDLVPVSQSVIGSNFGFDVNEIVVEVSPFVLEGQPGIPTKYWIELIVTDGGSTPNVFWVATSSTISGNPLAQFDAGWTYPDPIYDGVYIWSGECDTILNVGDVGVKLFAVYPNPAQDLINIKIPANIRLQNAALYDILGNNTGVRLINDKMNISQLSRGIYMLSIETSEGRFNRKVIKN